MNIIHELKYGDGFHAITYSDGATIIALLFQRGNFTTSKITRVSIAANSSTTISSEDFHLIQKALEIAPYPKS